MFDRLERDDLGEGLFPGFRLVLLARRVEPEGPGRVERVGDGKVGGVREDGHVALGGGVGVGGCFGDGGVGSGGSIRRQVRVVGRSERRRSVGRHGGREGEKRSALRISLARGDGGQGAASVDSRSSRCFDSTRPRIETGLGG